MANACGFQNLGGNVAGIITQPLLGFLTNSGEWGAFIGKLKTKHAYISNSQSS